MANINYNDLTQNESQERDYQVGFFSIKNGEEAIVRFAIDSVDDFELYTVHPITVGQSSFPNRRVSCLRSNPKTDPINICPLCARGEKVQQRIYIKMIQYVSENGKIVPKAVIWDRPAYSYAPQLKSYLDGYGPLSNILCKIVRQGEGLDTKYTIMPNLNPAQYNEQLYVKDFSGFDNYNVLGSVVMDKTFEEINEFITTGNFPQRNNQTPKEVYEYSEPVHPQTHAVPDFPDPMPATNVITPPWEADNVSPTINPNVPDETSQMARPTRYY